MQPVKHSLGVIKSYGKVNAAFSSRNIEIKITKNRRELNYHQLSSGSIYKVSAPMFKTQRVMLFGITSFKVIKQQDDITFSIFNIALSYVVEEGLLFITRLYDE